MPETISEFLEAYRGGRANPKDLIVRSFQRLRAYADPAMFISLREQAAIAEAEALASAGNTNLPLYGIPVAIKDNIDVAGLPTTAGCPAYARMPTHDSIAVARLKQAGAIIIGKTNLGPIRHRAGGCALTVWCAAQPIQPAPHSGRFKLGLRDCCLRGIVPLSLGTDTAGSGRVPASMNNIVGIKPSVGLIAATGVDPACRSLDCVSIFALTTDDAYEALADMAGPDRSDAFSRSCISVLSAIYLRSCVLRCRER